MRILVDNISDSDRVEIEYFFRPVKDETGKFIDTGKTTQSGPDPEDKEPLYHHRGKPVRRGGRLIADIRSGRADCPGQDNPEPKLPGQDPAAAPVSLHPYR